MNKGCPLCNKKIYTVIYKKVPGFDDASIVKCNHCSHIYTLLKSSAPENIYSDEVYKVIENRNSIFYKIINWEYKKIIKKINLLKPAKGAFLDFGCGKGQFAYLAKQKGWEVKCVETAAERAAYAKEVYSLDVDTNFYSTGKLFGGNFDVITFLHVLEHLPQPKILLQQLMKYNLTENGLIVIEVPNFKSLQAKIAGKKWMHLDALHHISHFTPTKLDQLAEALSLKIKYTSYFSFYLGVLGMTDALLKLFGYTSNIIYDLKNRRISLIIWIILLLPLAIVLEIIVSPISYGGIIRKFYWKEESAGADSLIN